MLKFVEIDDIYQIQTDNVDVETEQIEEDSVERAEKIIKRYSEKYNDICEFVFEEVKDFYNLSSVNEVEVALGKAVIDMDADTITYLEHTLDNEHIITVEYGENMDKLFYCSIDG